MNDMITVGMIVVAVGAVGLFLFAMHVYNGVYGNLASAKVGEVYNFEYEQPYHGEPKRVLAKVIEPVYTLEDSTIKKLNRRSGYRRNDPIFHRTKHIVVCEMPNGNVRQFYAERATNVRRTILGGQLFKVAALL